MLIAFTGPMRAGKSTSAMHLVVDHGFVRLSFAAPVRRDCARMLAHIEGRSFRDIEEEMRTTATKERYRGLLQWYGMHRRHDDPDHWVSTMRARLQMFESRGLDITIDDLRFHNEATLIRELGGHIICIESSRATIDPHESEHDWSRIAVDAVLWNDTTTDALHRSIDEALQQWR